MAGINMLQLPAYQAGPGIDFSLINNALDSNRQNALAQRQMGLAEQRNALMVKQDDRAAATHGLQIGKMKRDAEMQEARQVAGRVQYIQGLPPEQQGQAWQQTLQMPGFRDLPPDMHDFGRAAPMLLSKAAEYMDPMARQAQQATIGMTGAHADLYRAQAEKARREAATGGKASLVPIWGKGPNGEDVILQTRPDGSAVQTRLPEGVSVTGKTSKVDLGTHWGVMDQGGNLIGRVPKDIEGQQAAEARGQALGKAQVDLPRVEAIADRMFRQIKGVREHPNLERVTGIGGYFPTITSTSKDLERRIDQLTGSAFLQSFQDIKGAGAITEAEGAKATLAFARLADLTQSDAGYLQALKDVETEVRAVVRLAQQRARGAGPYVPAPGTRSDGVPRENTDRLPDPLGIR